MPQGAEAVLKEMCAFLKDLVGEYDIVISLERSGYRILQILEGWCFNFKLNHFPSRSVHLLELEGKKILLFDDVSTSGSRLKEMAEILKKKGAYVDTATYAILTTCPQDHRPTHYCEIVGLKGYEEISKAISDYMNVLDVPVETDHIQVDGSIEPMFSNETLERGLRELGDVYEREDLTAGFQLGLRYPEFSRPESLNLPYVTPDISTYKIRIKHKRRGDIQVIPLSFPVLQEAEGECKVPLPIRFCEKYAPIFESIRDGKMLLCCYCIIYNSTKDLLVSFFRAWKHILAKKGYRFKLKKVTYEDAKLVFNDESLENSIEEEIKRILNK